MWLLAIVTPSTPAARSASNALGLVRKWNVFGWGVPRSVTAVSRFSVVTSAADSSGVIDGPNAVAGSDSSFAVRCMKCTSPANSSVMSAGLALPLAPGDADGAVAWPLTNFAPAFDEPGPAWQPTTATPTRITARHAYARRSATGGRLRTASL